MDARIAEGLVRKWQNIKSQAFGPNHSVESLSEVRNSVVLWMKNHIIELVTSHNACPDIAKTARFWTVRC